MHAQADHPASGTGRIARIRHDGFSPAAFTSIAVTALVLLGAIVVTGGAVRLTGSGLGCTDWPNCNDDFFDLSSKHSAIEQLNRLFTFLVGVGVLLAAIAAWYRRPRRRDIVVLGAVVLGGVPAQGLIGAIVVWADLHPATVQLHFILSMVLVWAAVLLLARSREQDGGARVTVVCRRSVWFVRAVVALTALTVVLGTVVTGTGPHAGDEKARRFFGTTEFVDDEALHWVTRVHGASVWLAVLAVLTLAWVVKRSPDRRVIEGPLTAWMIVALVQGAVGYVQYALGVPVSLVIVHLAGATTLCGVTAWLWNSTTAPAPVADEG